jgi:hypothetical protein
MHAQGRAADPRSPDGPLRKREHSVAGESRVSPTVALALPSPRDDAIGMATSGSSRSNKLALMRAIRFEGQRGGQPAPCLLLANTGSPARAAASPAFVLARAFSAVTEFVSLLMSATGSADAGRDCRDGSKRGTVGRPVPCVRVLRVGVFVMRFVALRRCTLALAACGGSSKPLAGAVERRSFAVMDGCRLLGMIVRSPSAAGAPGTCE